jgi:hypothetical protein
MKRNTMKNVEGVTLTSYVTMQECCPTCEAPKLLPVELAWDAAGGLVMRQIEQPYCDCDPNAEYVSSINSEQAFLMFGKRDLKEVAIAIDDVTSYPFGMSKGMKKLRKEIDKSVDALLEVAKRIEDAYSKDDPEFVDVLDRVLQKMRRKYGSIR